MKKTLTGIQINHNEFGQVAGCVFFRDGLPRYYRLFHRQSKAPNIIALASLKFGPANPQLSPDGHTNTLYGRIK